MELLRNGHTARFSFLEIRCLPCNLGVNRAMKWPNSKGLKKVIRSEQTINWVIGLWALEKLSFSPYYSLETETGLAYTWQIADQVRCSTPWAEQVERSQVGAALGQIPDIRTLQDLGQELEGLGAGLLAALKGQCWGRRDGTVLRAGGVCN